MGSWVVVVVVGPDHLQDLVMIVGWVEDLSFWDQEGCVVRRPAGVGGWVGLRTWSLGSSGCVQQDSLVLILFYEDLQLTPGPGTS